MKRIKKSLNIITWGAIVLDLLYIFFGAFLISNPNMGTKAALVIVGIILIITGIFSISKYIMNNYKIFLFELTYGIISIVFGVLCLLNPFSVANFISIMVGIWLVTTSILKGIIALDFKKNKENTWLINLAMSLLIIIIGIILIVNPFVNYIIITTYVGVMIVIYSCIDILNQCIFMKRLDNILKFIK